MCGCCVVLGLFLLVFLYWRYQVLVVWDLFVEGWGICCLGNLDWTWDLG